MLAPEPCSFRGGGCAIQGGHFKVRGGLLPLHVLAVHASGGGHARAQLFATLNGAIRPNTLAVAGDFNHDLRSGVVDPVKFPTLARWTQQATKLPTTAISTAKERSPFQAQISKTLLPDATTKDFLLLNEARGFAMSGLELGALFVRCHGLGFGLGLCHRGPLEVWSPPPFDFGTGFLMGRPSRSRSTATLRAAPGRLFPTPPLHQTTRPCPRPFQ